MYLAIKVTVILFICLLCSDPLPLDLLSFVLERDPSKLVPGVQMKQADGVRGLHFSSPDTSLSFPSSQLLVNCDLFPKEFSIVLTLKVTDGARKVSIRLKHLCADDCWSVKMCRNMLQVITVDYLKSNLHPGLRRCCLLYTCKNGVFLNTYSHLSAHSCLCCSYLLLFDLQVNLHIHKFFMPIFCFSVI